MSPSSNDINPDIATKLPTNSLNSDDVILNIEGRERMRRPYERYMQQQAMQKALENTRDDTNTLHEQSENHQSLDIIHSNETVTAHQSTSPFCADTAKPTKKPRKSRSLNHAKFLSVMAIFCAVFLLAVFAFNYLLSKNSQVPLGVNSASVAQNTASAKQMNTNLANADIKTDPNSIPSFISPRDETKNERQNSNEQIKTMNAINAIKIKTTLSEHDFRQEAQNTFLRDSEKQASQKPDITIQPEINPQDFKAEAKSILYRDETKAGK